MASLKRRNNGLGLDRRVRPRIERDSDIEDVEASSEASHSDESESEGSEEDHGSDEENSSSDSGDSSGEDDRAPDLSQVSFGALAKAQASLPALGRRSAKASASGTQPAAGDDLVGARSSKSSAAEREKRAKRSSKHAPTEMSSKKPVSLRRDIVEVHKPQARDPRFGPLNSRPIDEAKARKAYAFLDEYRDDELKRLRAVAKKTKDPAAREELQRQVMSMESRKKAQERKDREKAVLEEHRRQEKELIKQGKKPFYLKKSEQKKRLLMDQYASMSQKQVDRLIERRRKKAAGKEKKSLPVFRRGAEAR